MVVNKDKDEMIRRLFDDDRLRVTEYPDRPPMFERLAVDGEWHECKWRWSPSPHPSNWGNARTNVGTTLTLYRSRMLMAAEDLHLVIHAYDYRTGERL